MPPQEALLIVFCLVDDQLKALGTPRLRARGPRPKLSDAEVITIELVGALWGLADDAPLLAHFRRYHTAEFPALAGLHRTTFARQAANLCWVKRALPRRWARHLAPPGSPWLIDSFPLPACRFARARRCRRFAGQAAFGFDHVANKAFYGFRVHLRTSPDGVILDFILAAANVAEQAVARELAPEPVGVGIGDRNYWSPELQAHFRGRGGELLAPYKHASRDPDPGRSRRLSAVRRRIETTIGQWVEHFHCRRSKVRDLWHLMHRLIRQALSHTLGIWLNVQAVREPLRLAHLAA
jgi:hypothetical protein